MAKKDRTLVTFLLDRTGSMDSVKQETISGFNAYIDELRKGKNIEFTLIQFDTQGTDKVCVCAPIATAPKLDNGNYQPRASTNLIDSAYFTIKAVEGQEKAKGAKIVICIQTDGQENSSHYHTWDELKKLIEEKQKLGWQFNFMGCGIDAYSQSALMGIAVADTLSYGTDHASNQAAYRGLASNTAMFSAGTRSNTSYTTAQKVGSGDKFFQNQTAAAPQGLNLNEDQKSSGFDLNQ